MAFSGDNHSGGKHGSNKDPEGFRREAESLVDYAADQLRKKRRSSHGGIQRASLLAREELKELGIAPTHMILELMQEAFKAFQEQKGEKDDGGAAYLGIAMDGAKTLAKYSYPTMKAVQISLDDGKKMFDATDPKQILDAAINDPFFTDEQKEELIKKLQAKKTMIDKSILPLGVKTVSEEEEDV